MNRLIAILALTLIILSSCSEEQSMTNETNLQSISNFKLDTLTPIRNEKIRLVYCSSVDNPNIEKDYLIQFVAVLVETGDSINIISDHSEHIKKDDADQIFLLNRRSLSDFHIQQDVDKEVYENMKQKGVDMNAMVISNPNFQTLENNNLMTIIGEISR